MLPNRGFEAPKMDTDGLLADCGRRSWGGDSMKHSSRDIEVDVDNLLLPAPKRKGGNWSEFRVGNVFVEYPLVRLREGLINVFLRRSAP